jgi:catechol 2,3-dioxygenase-like lactoylglutathione lyase family enzyme
MAIHRLNHAVLYVRDVARSVAFYSDLLGFEVVMQMGGKAAFLRAPESSNDHDLGLFEIGGQAGPSQAGRATVGLYHLAWEVDTLRDLEQLAGRLAEAGALVGTSDHSTTKSLYAQDPDGVRGGLDRPGRTAGRSRCRGPDEHPAAGHRPRSRAVRRRYPRRHRHQPGPHGLINS